MNNSRRKAVKAIIKTISSIQEVMNSFINAEDSERGAGLLQKLPEELAKCQEICSNQIPALEAVVNEEQEAYDNLPENFQDSDRGVNIEYSISSLDSAMFVIQLADRYLNEAIEKLSSAAPSEDPVSLIDSLNLESVWGSLDDAADFLTEVL